MRTLGNILWHFPFFGFITAFLIFLTGLLLTALVITAPIGTGLMQYARFLLAPYTNAMVRKDDLQIQQNSAWKTYSTIIMLLYLPLGLVLAALQVFQIAALCISIIGIPVAIPLAKGLSTVLNPVGKICVPVAVRNELDARKAQEQVANHLS